MVVGPNESGEGEVGDTVMVETAPEAHHVRLGEGHWVVGVDGSTETVAGAVDDDLLRQIIAEI